MTPTRDEKKEKTQYMSMRSKANQKEYTKSGKWVLIVVCAMPNITNKAMETWQVTHIAEV